MPHKWTQEDEEFLKEKAFILSARDIAKYLSHKHITDISIQAVRHKIRKMGLKNNVVPKTDPSANIGRIVPKGWMEW